LIQILPPWAAFPIGASDDRYRGPKGAQRSPLGKCQDKYGPGALHRRGCASAGGGKAPQARDQHIRVASFSRDDIERLAPGVFFKTAGNTFLTGSIGMAVVFISTASLLVVREKPKYLES
jgi:hypothetical protein